MPLFGARYYLLLTGARKLPAAAPGVKPSADPAIPKSRGNMYIVRMKRITASEARKNWFRILDEVAAGGEVVIERHGRRIVLRREEPDSGEGVARSDYGALLRVPEGEQAEEWGWEWGPDGDLEPS